jgi:hypothetical protein
MSEPAGGNDKGERIMDEGAKVMALDIARLLPRWGDANRPPVAAYWFLIVIAAISTVRSLVHMLAPDGGAHSIAGIAFANVVAIFAQWGASQLVLAIVYWVAILRYPMLTPLMLAIIVVEQLLRLLAGELKPFIVAARRRPVLITPMFSCRWRR